MNKKQKPYEQMNTAELAEATKEFDQEFIGDKAIDPTPAQRKEYREKIKRGRANARGRGRPRHGKGAKRINITVEPQLLKRINRFAKQTKMNRSELIAHSLLAMMCRKSA